MSVFALGGRLLFVCALGEDVLRWAVHRRREKGGRAKLGRASVDGKWIRSVGPGRCKDGKWTCPLSIFTGALLTSPRPLTRSSQYLGVLGTGQAEPPHPRSPTTDVPFSLWSSAGSVSGSEGRGPSVE